jgi:hypothetical protein
LIALLLERRLDETGENESGAQREIFPFGKFYLKMLSKRREREKEKGDWHRMFVYYLSICGYCSQSFHIYCYKFANSRISVARD